MVSKWEIYVTKIKLSFLNGPWCKKGQFVIYGRYAGARFKTNYGEHRILNDDEIIGTIEETRGHTRTILGGNMAEQQQVELDIDDAQEENS